MQLCTFRQFIYCKIFTILVLEYLQKSHDDFFSFLASAPKKLAHNFPYVFFRLAVKRLIWGKMINLGQTCVAPDYVMCSSKLQEKLLPMIKEILEEYFGKEPENSPDLCRIVSDRHYQRLVSMIENTKSNIVLGKNFSLFRNKRFMLDEIP